MRDLLSAMRLFTNMKLFKNNNIETSDRFTLCYFPLVGLIMGIAISVIYALAPKTGYGYVAGPLAVVLIAVITGKVHYSAVLENMGKTMGTLLYIIYLIPMFLLYSIKEAVVCIGVFILARTMTIFLIMDNDNLKEGIYKSLELSSQRFAVSIITVVWLMAAVAIIQMISFGYFIIAFIVFALTYFIFSRRAKIKKSLTDMDINLFVVLSEALMFLCINIKRYMPIIITVFRR